MFLCLPFQTFTEGHRFFEQYEIIFTGLKQAAEVYVKSDSSSKNLICLIVYYLNILYILIWVQSKWSYYQFHVTGSKTCNRGKSKNSLTMFKTLTVPVSCAILFYTCRAAFVFSNLHLTHKTEKS